MRDTAPFPVTACSQRLQSSRKREKKTGEGREEDKWREKGRDRHGRKDQRDFRGEGEGCKPLSKDAF